MSGATNGTSQETKPKEETKDGEWNEWGIDLLFN